METLRIRPDNAVIRELNISQEKIEKIKEMLRKSSLKKTEIIKKIIGTGPCTACGEIPSVELSWQVGDKNQSMKRVERYCDNCAKTLFERTTNEPEDKNKLAALSDKIQALLSRIEAIEIKDNNDNNNKETP